MSKKIVLLNYASGEAVIISNLDDIKKKAWFNSRKHSFPLFVEWIIDGLWYNSNEISWGEVTKIRSKPIRKRVVEHIKRNGYLE